MKKTRKKIGLPPGSVIFTGNRKVEKVFIHYLQYDGEELNEKTLDNQKDIIFQQASDEKMDWYDIRGLHDTQLIELLGQTFSVHPLILEDVADIQQRPKFEEYEKGNFVIIRALSFDQVSLEVKTEQVAFYFRKGLLISFQETASDLFEAVRQRLHSGRGKVRQRGADYLCYALLDNIVDHYYIIFDEIGNAIEALETELLDNPDSSIKERIHRLKKELLTIRKSIAPLREAISRFSKSDSPFIEDSSAFFVRDLYDHTVQVMDMVETYRDVLNGLQDLYFSEISFRMNQVMQVLTIITALFVPPLVLGRLIRNELRLYTGVAFQIRIFFPFGDHVYYFPGFTDLL